MGGRRAGVRLLGVRDAGGGTGGGRPSVQSRAPRPKEAARSTASRAVARESPASERVFPRAPSPRTAVAKDARSLWCRNMDVVPCSCSTAGLAPPTAFAFPGKGTRALWPQVATELRLPQLQPTLCTPRAHRGVAGERGRTGDV